MTQGLVTPVTAALTNPLTNDLGVKLKYCVTAFFFEITNRPGPPFPASRGLSRRDKMEREERDLACFLFLLSYHACARVSLTTSDVFVTCETTQKTGLNLSARSILNGPIRVEGETTLERPLYKTLRKAEEANFKANFSFFASLSAAKAHLFGVKFIGLYETLVL